MWISPADWHYRQLCCGWMGPGLRGRKCRDDIFTALAEVVLTSTLPTCGPTSSSVSLVYSLFLLFESQFNPEVEMTVPVAGRGPQVEGVAGFFLALSTITILLRCYCRALVVKSFGVDDWSALVAWVRFLPSVNETLDAHAHRYSSFSSVLL